MTVCSLFEKTFLCSTISLHWSIERCCCGDLYLRNGSLKEDVRVVGRSETCEMAVKSGVTFDGTSNISSSRVG